ncbi:MAG: ORF6N domain-containing protein [Butyrivibrio sp.]|nr:ORF6N domain-containing protein [Butyrivibrio sp.]
MEENTKEIIPPEIDEELLRCKLYEFRGRKVMLDADLAEIYGYETKNFKRQVNNNRQKFEGEDFMFELTDEETEILSRCNNFTLNRKSGRGSNIKYNPYVFTEQRIYMLMTVLRGDLAIKEYPAVQISMQQTGGIFHDRFIVLDYGTANERVFLCGASSKDAGAKITSIVEDYGIAKYKPVISSLLQNPPLILPK